jgi:hypothetical protein
MAKKHGKTDGGTEVRCLYDSAAGKCNDVVVLNADDLALHLAAGDVDPDETAVEYAKTLKQNGGDQ